MSTKEKQTPEMLARRAKAFEAYQLIDDQGKRRTLQAIALQVGATLAAVKYWKRVDCWDDKIAEAANASVKAADASSNAIRSLLRAGMVEHIQTLNKMIRKSGTKDADKIRGIREFAGLVKLLDALGDEPTPIPTGAATPQFNDDIPQPPVILPPDPPVEEPTAIGVRLP